jgi:hypothetical protein
MKNYKVKASHLYVGMDFYHVEGIGAYFGGEVIVKITKTPDTEAIDEINAKPAGPIQVETLSRDGWNRTHYMNPNDIVYPLHESESVTIFTKLKWRLRWLYYTLYNAFGIKSN